MKHNMKGREGKGPPSTDLLVCFPSRAHHLTLMPKPICSPARHSESKNRYHHHHHQHQKKLSSRSGRGQASLLTWARSGTSAEIAEPTSPKVTCAGQIKARAGPARSCRNWQSVMEEIERLHRSQKYKRRSAWIDAATFGLKKDVTQFLTCLRNIRFDFRCLGAFPAGGADVTSDGEFDDEAEEEDSGKDNGENESSGTVFSKWFMVLQENRRNHDPESSELVGENVGENGTHAPPPNALLLMRCRSAPAKGWLEERPEKQNENKKKEENEKSNIEEIESENEKKKESLVVMGYGKDFYKFSSGIAKETWVVEGIKDPLSRSRSWKR